MPDIRPTATLVAASQPSVSAIYVITNHMNGKEYIGSTLRPDHRFSQHTYRLRSRSHGNSHLQNAYNQAGSGAFTYDLLEYCQPEDLLQREDWWIDLLGTLDPAKGYNLKKAERPVMSTDTKARIASRLTGNSHWRGRRHSAESRAKMSESQRARVRDPEWAKKAADTNRGRTLSPEHQSRISAGLKEAYATGRREATLHSPETRAKISAAKKGCPAHNKGKPMSDEQRAAIAATKRRNRATMEDA